MDHSLKTIPPLETLRAFEAAAKTGSFSSAAERLNLTHGAISRQIAKLETWLGLRVFERGARGVSLTMEGQRLFLRTSEAFALIADTTDRWSEPRGPAVVRLTSIPSLSGLWLMPRLAELEAGEPKLRIVLEVDARQADLADEGIDISIRCGRGRIPGRVSVQLFEEHCFPIASPALANKIGKGAPDRLLAYPLIHDSDASGWRAWFGAHGIDYKPRLQDRRFEDYNLVLDAAAHGLGIALARPPLTKNQLASGRLKEVDKRVALNPVSYWMDRPEGQPRPAACELAKRIGIQAGLPPEKVEAFLKSDR
ncbi:LysR substrate-binding domain-containing protein [Mesorhizobium sp. SB112]|uniref:LysR substrate-binding domain-containing protein n=1 Tax=Mesorhizobium sp. SB112 TaxID=3151853 RepID=UPI0032640745